MPRAVFGRARSLSERGGAQFLRVGVLTQSSHRSVVCATGTAALAGETELSPKSKLVPASAIFGGLVEPGAATV